MFEHLLYRVYPDGKAIILGKFETLAMAKLSASLLQLEKSSFILAADMSKIYFYTNNDWEADIFTPEGRESFLRIYPNPFDYK